ncbi:S8 family serine peptidase [Streptomyces tsukubensis]|uniref:Peptidase S8 n=1 Tax=Streptomyces tsukubensis TaxID=83656 RepID=A0A1V4A6B2_9ACTN|nr:S8 family serine peptidase [Streptomyces tsukubensis]OON76643.1 peptidase S8 [Streptomyces tsukubensis]QFR93393.1 S8 family serine peptidase [Streptomyces tsukubensis]
MTRTTRGTGWRRATLLPAGLALVLLPTGQFAHAEDAPSQSSAAKTATNNAAHAARTVTLVTGDKVTVTDLGAGKKTVTVERAKGATGAVRSETSGGHVTVIPDEARPYLDAGTLDRRLFDVGELIRQGYADPVGAQAKKGGTTGLPLIVTYKKKNARSAPAPLDGTRKVRSLPSVGGVAVEADKGGAFWSSVTKSDTKNPTATQDTRSAAGAADTFAAGVGKIWLDGKVEADMAESNAQIGTSEAWQAGLTGKGVKVAVLDTGIDADHPDLKGRVSESKSFIEGEETADRNGHGTHTASTVGGSGAASDGKEKGVAPDADLAVGKVLSDAGEGSESQIIAGMEWASKDLDAKVVSMSLGSTEASDGTDPMAQAVNTLSEENDTLFVIAAGNAGTPVSVGSPGAADDALTIGAVDSTDTAAYFTSQGPRLGDNALKPDLSAPGVDILAARSHFVTGEGDYTTMSGTSMATPHVAGVAALLAQKHPDWTWQQLKDGLMSSSEELDASAYALGAGRVSVPDALDARITASGSADLGFYGWPYEDNKPVTKTVSYANSSDSPVTLTLSARGAGAGVVKLADSTLTVPAHSTASTTVTGDGTDAPVGNTSGQILAKEGDKTVAHTVFGLVKEEERYTLTVHVKDRAGAPTAAPVAVQQLTRGADPAPYTVGDSGTLKLRLKPGTYALSSFLDVTGSHGKDSLGMGFLTDPEVTLDKDREVTLDGSKLREVKAEVSKRTETRQLLMEFDRTANGATFGGAVQVPLTYDSIFAAPTTKPKAGTFEYRTVWRLGKPTLEAKADGKKISDARTQYGSADFTGKQKLTLVDAGNGSAAAYEGKNVKGRAVLVHADGTLPGTEIGGNAQTAGAKALFVTDDQPGRLMENFGTEEGESRSLPVATVNAADGATLAKAAARDKKVQLTGATYSPYMYDLSQGHPGSIPAKDLTYKPGKRDLGVVDVKAHAPKATEGGEFRYSITDTFPIGFGFAERVAYPAERTDYVSTGTGQKWHETLTTKGGALEERSGLVTYQGGKEVDLDWFKPVLHPWLGTGLGWGQTRSGNDLQFNTPGWGDSGPDHTGFGDVWNDPSMTQTTEVFADGKSVDKATSSGAYAWDSDPAEKTYKVVTDTTLDPETWRLGTKGHSAWTFRSKETPADRETYLPLLNLGYDVDTDLSGDVKAGKKLTVSLFSEYVVGANDTGKISGGTLKASYDDGKTWKSVSLKKDGSKATWKGKISVPKGAAFISLRASASDNRGGSVEQEIIRAVGVK